MHPNNVPGFISFPASQNNFGFWHDRLEHHQITVNGDTGKVSLRQFLFEKLRARTIEDCLIGFNPPQHVMYNLALMPMHGEKHTLILLLESSLRFLGENQYSDKRMFAVLSWYASQHSQRKHDQCQRFSNVGAFQTQVTGSTVQPYRLYTIDLYKQNLENDMTNTRK